MPSVESPMDEHPDAEAVPRPPQISVEQLEKCRKTGDFCPILFEWYKFTGALCNFFASIKHESAALRNVLAQEYYLLIGLLNRCSRLMLANVALSHEGVFGETTAIIDRCIFESAVKVVWLAESPVPDKFQRLIADGLKTELEFRDKINANIEAREGDVLAIEKRMLSSIENHITSSGMSAAEIATSKKCPDLASMIDGIYHDRLLYLVGQKMGSHHVHGTWPSLRLHYLEEGEDGELRPRDHNCETHVNQYVFIPLVVLAAMGAFVRFVLTDAEDQRVFLNLLKSVQEKINKINVEVVGDDFSQAKEI